MKTCARTWSRRWPHWRSCRLPERPFIAYIGSIYRIETEGLVATPNYGYEKRQKELAKKRKKEDKLKAKADRKTGMPGETDTSADEPGEPGPGNQVPNAPPQT